MNNKKCEWKMNLSTDRKNEQKIHGIGNERSNQTRIFFLSWIWPFASDFWMLTTPKKYAATKRKQDKETKIIMRHADSSLTWLRRQIEMKKSDKEWMEKMYTIYYRSYINYTQNEAT